MDNDIAGIPQALQKSGCLVKAICARLKGKVGRLCGKVMGKGVDFLAWTVITGGPNLELDKVGVPRLIGMTLTALSAISLHSTVAYINTYCTHFNKF